MKSDDRLRVRLTAAGCGLLFVLLAIWYGASSQNNAAAYLLFFALGSVAAVSIAHTLLNVAGLAAMVEAPKPVFAGDEVSLPVEIGNTSRRFRYFVSIQAADSGGEEERVDEIGAARAARTVLRFTAPTRGHHLVEKLRLSSAYPLGIVRATKSISTSQAYLVYPKPEGERPLPESFISTQAIRPDADTGDGDEFAGVRPYVPGESQRHVDWKAVARGQPMLTKKYQREVGGTLSLDFAKVPGNDLEARLRQLTQWVLEAERSQRSYSLRLPGVIIHSSLGEMHLRQCLRALALFT
ncbi:MAG: DUF58 domain-containing protein [Verrucomicrobiota bacterium]